MSCRKVRFAPLLLLGAWAALAEAQTQVRPRVMIVVDTSGSMTGTFADDKTHSDGSLTYFDPSLQSPIFPYPGLGSTTGANTCPSLTDPTANPGYQSRAAVAKRAITNVVNASGDIDWGLMRFSATQCTLSNTLVYDGSTGGPGTDVACTSDYDCGRAMYCVDIDASATTTLRCRRPVNLCADPNYGNEYELARSTSSNDGSTCNNAGSSFNENSEQGLRASVTGNGCGTGHNDPTSSGEADKFCQSKKACTTDAECGGAVGSCGTQTNNPVRVCTCGTCPTGYDCVGGICRYGENCYGETSTGSTLLVDPSAATATTQILQWTDGYEVWDASGPTNPEVRFIQGGTPLGGALRTATTWYNGVVDANKTCRPYTVVLLTDGQDNCRENSGRGPVSGAESFVAATVNNARVPNKVYVIGIAANAGLQTTLNNMAVAGGTTSARFSNSQADIEAALADVISESVLFEKCNGIDDDCDGLVDEGFGVYEECVPTTVRTQGTPATPITCPTSGRWTCANSTQCSTGYSCITGFCTATCTSGIGPCLNSGVRQCLANGTAACGATPLPAPGAESTFGCNNRDDDCDGYIDDCTNASPNTCSCGGCTGQPEICNGLDDDCVSGADNNPVDVGLPCGVGACVGTTVCSNAGTSSALLTCSGGTGSDELCNMIDDDCDGVVDNFTEACPPVSGQCDPGVRTCTNGAYGVCTGIVAGGTEICNGLDDNCDGTPDNGVTDSWVNTDCCPTGNNADCCQLGKYQCVDGGQTCVGATIRSTEVCDGVDNDCNNMVDDVAGIGQACTSGSVVTGGTCRAEYICTGTAGTGPLGLTCTQTVGPTGEVCNGDDDDCDGIADNNITSATDPRVGVEGGAPCMALPDGQMALPCTPGTTACEAGEIVCQGYVGPQPNLCDGISRDCTGMPNMNGDCPAGFECYQGNCVTPCGMGEFPCQGGFVCEPVSRLCIPDVCNKANCPPGQICELADDGSAVCKDPCENVTCPEGATCTNGVCASTSCKTQGCPTGQLCQGTPPECVPDPCATKICETNEYCNLAGECERICENACLSGTVCIDGLCQTDPCAGKNCPAGQLCVLSGDQGVCVESFCGNECGTSSRVCCGGTCRPDPCSALQCPVGTVCQLDPACGPQCVAQGGRDPVQIVGAGGGGVGCTTGGEGVSGSLFSLLVAMLWLARRRAVKE